MIGAEAKSRVIKGQMKRVAVELIEQKAATEKSIFINYCAHSKYRAHKTEEAARYAAKHGYPSTNPAVAVAVPYVVNDEKKKRKIIAQKLKNL